MIKKGDRILVGFSGGPDSTCLLLALLLLRKKLKIDVSAVCVNYGARKSATRDEAFCKKVCAQEKIDLYVYNLKKKALFYLSFENPKKETLRSFGLPSALIRIANFEERARAIRYFVFENLACKKRFSKIATAHNLNDQAETVLINFLRGGGIKGIGGMDFKREKLIRPLLAVKRKEILEFLKEKKQKFVTDETNFDPSFTRNKVRHKLLKEIENSYNPNIVETLGRNSLLYREAWKTIEKISQKKLKKYTVRKSSNSILIAWKETAKEPFIVRSTMLREIIFKLRGNLNNVSWDLIEKTINYLDNPQKRNIFSQISQLTIKKNGVKVWFDKE